MIQEEENQPSRDEGEGSQKTEHSELPWAVGVRQSGMPDSIDLAIGDATDYVIARVGTEADAELIVRAVNAYHKPAPQPVTVEQLLPTTPTGNVCECRCHGYHEVRAESCIHCAQ